MPSPSGTRVSHTANAHLWMLKTIRHGVPLWLIVMVITFQEEATMVIAAPNAHYPVHCSTLLQKKSLFGYHLLFYFEVNTYLCNHTKVELLEWM